MMRLCASVTPFLSVGCQRVLSCRNTPYAFQVMKKANSAS